MVNCCLLHFEGSSCNLLLLCYEARSLVVLVNRIISLTKRATSSKRSLSLLRHGFYPGYYVTFFSVAFLTVAARKVRRNVRPFFQSSSQMAFLYDAITWTCTRLACPYLAAPFVFLSLRNTWTFYSSYFFFLHLGSAILIVALPEGKSSSRPTTTKKSETAVKSSEPVTPADLSSSTTECIPVASSPETAPSTAQIPAEGPTESKKEL